MSEMNVVVLRGQRDMGIDRREVPTPKPYEALIRMEGVGLCGTDFHIWLGEANYNADSLGRPIPLHQQPQILGHEVTGKIVALGPSVTDLKVGDRVSIDQGLNCKSHRHPVLCEFCETGDSHQCEHFAEFGISGPPGGLAEYMAIPAVNLIRIESDLDPACAAMVEPLACVLHANEFMERAHTRYGLTADAERRAKCVLICGAGPAGQLFVQVLRNVLNYDGRIVVSEPSAKKRALAKVYGAEVIDPVHGDLVAEMQDITSGRGVEVVIEASGNGPLFRQMPGLIRKQCTLMLYGHGHGGVGMDVLNEVQWREPAFLSPIGASGGFDPDGRPRIYREALRLIEDGIIDVETLITHRIDGLAAVPAAFESFGGEDYLKGVAVLA